MYSKIKYLLLQSIFILLSPISSLLISLRYYKSGISQFFFVIFAVYLGCYMGFVFDLMQHYQNMVLYYVGRPLEDILSDPRIYIIGPDYYHITLKYVVSRFSSSYAVFGGAAAFVYTCCFIFFYRQLKQFYTKQLSYFSVLLLICVVTIIEFWWYQGVRFWTGAFYFFGAYMKYVNTSKKRYYLLTIGAVYFHYTLIILVLTGLINYVLSFVSKYYRIVLLAISFFYKSLNADFVPWMLNNIPWARENLGIAITDEKIHNSWQEFVEEFRASENIVYGHRLPFLMFAAFATLAVFMLNKIKFNQKYLTVFYFSITLWAVANFGFGNLTFYTRFFEASVLMMYVYVFIISVIHQNEVKRYRLALTLFLILPVLYSILPTLVQYRAHLFHPELIFGSFFMDWDGNALKIDYAWK